jgi:hypothetical protein
VEVHQCRHKIFEEIPRRVQENFLHTNITGNNIFFYFGKEKQVVSHSLFSIPVRSSSRDKRGEGKVLRVVLLPDGETVHNAFFGRGFKGGKK